jgi:mycofactocin precursor
MSPIALDTTTTGKLEETSIVSDTAATGLGLTELVDLVDLVDDETLIEEISIDGMCGVY